MADLRGGLHAKGLIGPGIAGTRRYHSIAKGKMTSYLNGQDRQSNDYNGLTSNAQHRQGDFMVS